MKGTLTIDGVTVEIKLTEEQVKQVKEAIEPKEKKITWDELREDDVEGYRVTAEGVIGEVTTETWAPFPDFIFKTENQARAVLAIAKLSQLMAHEYYNGDWQYDWNPSRGQWDDVYGIYYDDGIKTSAYDGNRPIHFLKFKDEETRDRFLEHHRELIEKYFLLYQ